MIVNKTNNAQGTPYHPGGLAMVNDQKGPTYKELISLPNGVSFIPEGRDVTMPLPRGTKILKASKTAQLIPKYADGTGGIPANAKIFRDMRAVQQQIVVSAPAADNSINEGTLNHILETLKIISQKETAFYFDGKLIGRAKNKQDAQRLMEEMYTQQIKNQRGGFQ